MGEFYLEISYIPADEYAAKAGITREELDSLLDGVLKSRCKIICGRVYVDETTLSYFMRD